MYHGYGGSQNNVYVMLSDEDVAFRSCQQCIATRFHRRIFNASLWLAQVPIGTIVYNTVPLPVQTGPSDDGSKPLRRIESRWPRAFQFGNTRLVHYMVQTQNKAVRNRAITGSAIPKNICFQRFRLFWDSARWHRSSKEGYRAIPDAIAERGLSCRPVPDLR